MKKETIVRDFGEYTIPEAELYDLNEMKIQRCTGCWSCWVITPGKCVFKDLDRFYHSYISSERVTFFLRPQNGFVSVRFKMLMDRMCPLFLPYIQFENGGSWHMDRYESYPDITVYYDDNFTSEEERANFCDYVNWVFVQFKSKSITIMPLSEYTEVNV